MTSKEFIADTSMDVLMVRITRILKHSSSIFQETPVWGSREAFQGSISQGGSEQKGVLSKGVNSHLLANPLQEPSRLRNENPSVDGVNTQKRGISGEKEGELNNTQSDSALVRKGVPIPQIRYGSRYTYSRYDPNEMYKLGYTPNDGSTPEPPLLFDKSYFYYSFDKDSLNEFAKYPINQYDPSSISYPVPFNELYHHKELRYERFNGPHPILPSFVHFGEIQQAASKEAFLMMTGASSNHFTVSIICLLSMVIHRPDASIAYVDLGLQSNELKELAQTFTMIHSYFQRNGYSSQLYYRKFNFHNFPSWMNISNPYTIAGYAWKSITYIDMLREWKAYSAWIDAGNMITTSMKREMQFMKLEGLYSPRTAADIRRWVFTKSIEFMEGVGMVKATDVSKNMAAGNYIFIDYWNERARKEFINPLYQCSFTQRCIIPQGGDRQNTRGDQSVMSVFIHNMKLQFSANDNYQIICEIHMDSRNQEYLNNLKRRFMANLVH